MKIAIFDPYLDTVGGGERYMLTIAELLASRGHQVHLFWSKPGLDLSIYNKRFNIDLSKIHVQSNNIFEQTKTSFASLVKKYLALSKFDICIYLGDGSIPFLFAKKNYLHVQVPFRELRITPVDKLKLALITKIICNSVFTQKITETTLNTTKTALLHPPVNTDSLYSSPNKLPQILSVARFDNILHSKRQDILISTFKKLHLQFPEFKLILSGASKVPEHKNKYITELKHQATGLPITFLINPSSKILTKTYSESTFFWHAAGFGVDEYKDPERTEHFGIVFVEAQASGVIPFGVDKGGIREIITPGINGFVYTTQEELLSQTINIYENPKLISQIRQECLENSQRFSLTNFNKNLFEILAI